MLAVAAGLILAQACVMSMLVFTGASQFAFVGVLAGGGGALAAMGPAVVLALRNAAYGLSLAPILHGRLRRRALAAQLVIDETTAMARAEDDPAAARRAFLATGVSVWLCWNAGTLAGALLGGGSATRARSASTRCSRRRSWRCSRRSCAVPVRPSAALGGALIALALVPFTRAGVPVIAALAAVVPGVLLARGAGA